VNPRVIVGGLGPAGPELLTHQVTELVADHPTFLRTARHRAAEGLDLPSFDSVYERADSFDDVYAAIVDRLAEEAATHGTVGYLVPGSPLVAERTVELLRQRVGLDIEVLNAVSFLDLVWSVLEIDPLDAGVRLIDGHRFAEESAGERGPLLVAQCHNHRVLSDVKLAIDSAGFTPGGANAPTVTVLQRLGLADQCVFDVSWEDLDRSFEPDHLTSLYIQEFDNPIGAEIVKLHDIAQILRVECLWDKEQTHQSLVRHLVEETYEVIEAIDQLNEEQGEGYDDLAAELGDLLFQVVIHSVIAGEYGYFDLSDVARGIRTKLIRRHPHVFDIGESSEPGIVASKDPSTVSQTWEQIKAVERGDGPDVSAVEGLTPMPALMRAAKLIRKMSATGFDWGVWTDALAKLREEVDEVAAAGASGNPAEMIHELGDVVLAATVLAQHLGVDLDEATRRAIERVSARFQAVEQQAKDAGVGLDEADEKTWLSWWAEAKRLEIPSEG